MYRKLVSDLHPDRELSDLTMPFVEALGLMSPQMLTPDSILRSIDDEVRSLQQTLAELQSDAVRYRDVQQLKRDLPHHALDVGSDDLMVLVDSLMRESGLGDFGEAGRSRRRRR